MPALSIRLEIDPAAAVPWTEVIPFQTRDPEEKSAEMEFRMVYEGPLDPQTSHGRVKEKHALRQHWHTQLKELWQQFIFLKRSLDYWENQYKRDGFRFVPLVNENQAGWCSLDVLFLRRDMPGSLVKSGGDIDNRIKILFDSLRMPKGNQELGGAVPGDGEDPFFCLMEDDKFVTEIRVTTDRLLKPLGQLQNVNDVVLVVLVKTGVIEFDEFVSR
jgi:hypothetical protein